ncbi:MAG: hypothetical protein J6N99_04200, partial [Schwartzia sp.]|nr:hypothetical protein [Schwartzia sp. (in: firmicutes)]
MTILIVCCGNVCYNGKGNMCLPDSGEAEDCPAGRQNITIRGGFFMADNKSGEVLNKKGALG